MGDTYKLAMVAKACNPSYLGDGGRTITRAKTAQRKLGRHYLKIKIGNKKGCCEAQVEEELPSLYK
jgi:hypothetical protein